MPPTGKAIHRRRWSDKSLFRPRLNLRNPSSACFHPQSALGLCQLRGRMTPQILGCRKFCILLNFSTLHNGAFLKKTNKFHRKTSIFLFEFLITEPLKLTMTFCVLFSLFSQCQCFGRAQLLESQTNNTHDMSPVNGS